MIEDIYIYCIEGVHDWGEGELEPSVAPMLDLLRRTGYWQHIIHRTCGTSAELKYRLQTEWPLCRKGSVLYFNTHGSKDQIWLENKRIQVEGLTALKEWIGENRAEGRHIHFGGCGTFSDDDHNVKELMKYTGATSISGYAADELGWLEQSKPGLALELLFFGRLSEINLSRNSQSRSIDLRKIKVDIQKRFAECRFEMQVRRYKKP